MLATLVIGLREGLEAALIVGIIAAFLKKNGKSLTPMWIGVVFAVALSIAVGVALSLVEKALPQAAQEGMESIIGAIAIVFVTGMIVWMNTHARGMKRELEAQASEALHDGTAHALAIMAFLAVLKEGFETSVFLLATFSASENGALAALGAVIGVLIAVAIGVGLYYGGVKINLAKFFRYTGVFLVLVAAGLVLTMLRTAHEAGWINAGQQSTVNLSWLVKPGSVQAALITGVLGIPTDPRVIEVLGWFAYLVPVALFVYWPVKHRAKGFAVAAWQFSLAGAVALLAIGLVVLVPGVKAPQLGAAPLVGASSTSASAAPAGTAQYSKGVLRLTLGTASTTTTIPASAGKSVQLNGIDVTQVALPLDDSAADAPTTLTLDQLMALSGGRIPVGINAQQDPGPFTAQWSSGGSTQLWLAGGTLIDGASTAKSVVTVTGGGLSTSRTFQVDASNAAPWIAPSWQVSPAYAQRAQNAIGDADAARTERALWAVELPIFLGLAALVLAAFGARSLRRARAARAASRLADSQTTPRTPSPQLQPAAPQRSNTYAAH